MEVNCGIVISVVRNEKVGREVYICGGDSRKCGYGWID